MQFQHKNIFFIQEHGHKNVFHGGVGNADVEKILLQKNFQPILFPFQFSFSLKAKAARLKYLFTILFSLKPGSILIAQFPLYAKMNKLLIWFFCTLNRGKIIYIVMDIDGLKDGNEKILQKELTQLKKCRHFIVHNKNMQQWLAKKIPSGKYSLLNFFDFLAPYSFKQKSKENIIAFAGNLSKSLFLEDLDQVSPKKLQFNLYGPGVTELMIAEKNIFYKGVFEPYSLPNLLEGAFGLVWDGDKIDSEGGSIGKYMRYITHHKISLYILSGMPIIIYEKAGAAELIKQYHIGFTVSDLFEIEEKIKTLTNDDHNKMISNMRVLARKISSGGFLENALNEIIDKADH